MSLFQIILLIEVGVIALANLKALL